MMPFYEFHQNNSWGVFDLPAMYVLIEANSIDEANQIALDNGLYFDGCDKGLDCPCCGDRWWPARENDVLTEPVPYGKDEVNMELVENPDEDTIYDVFVIFKNGEKRYYWLNNDPYVRQFLKRKG